MTSRIAVRRSRWSSSLSATESSSRPFEAAEIAGTDVTLERMTATGDPGSSRAGRRQQQRRQQQRRRTIVIATVVGSLLVVAAIVAIVLVVTREDDTQSASTSSSRSTTTSPSSTTTTTTLPVSTTAVPASDNPVVALAQQYDGRYVGTFTNTTFNTTGPASLELRIDPTAGTIAVDADFDGDLFGGGADEIRRISGSIAIGDPTATVTTDTEKFGPVTGHIDESLALVLTADDVPDDEVKSFTLTGRLRDDNTGFDATYSVVFEDGKTADGTVAVTCDPSGNRGSDVTTVCALTAPSP
jgi:hypothetical protein